MVGKRILIIEDDEQTRCFMQEFLEEAGYKVSASPQLATLIGEAKSGNYDLITLDLGLPEIRGTDVADLLTAYTETPILVVSGNLDEVARQKLGRAGVTDYVQKPFRMKDLLETIGRMVEAEG